jgi:hypothetical protein
MMAMLITVIMLVITPTVGSTPLDIEAKITADPIKGQVCLAWGYEDTESGVDCWDVTLKEHQWTHGITLSGPGIWHVIASVHGINASGQRVDQKAPEILVQVDQ